MIMIMMMTTTERLQLVALRSHLFSRSCSESCPCFWVAVRFALEAAFSWDVKADTPSIVSETRD
jgi:hypothetical protein